MKLPTRQNLHYQFCSGQNLHWHKQVPAESTSPALSQAESTPLILYSSTPLLLYSSAPLLLYSSAPLLLYSSAPLLLYSSTPLLLYSSAPLLLYSSAPLLLYSSTPLLLYSFLPSSRSTTLVVPVANDTAYSITVVYKYSSQDAHGTDQPVLIGYAFHWLFEPLPFYGFVFVFLSSSSPSFLFCALAGFHLECTSNSLGATSLWPADLPEAMKSF